MSPATFKSLFQKHFPEPCLTALSHSTTGLCPHPRNHPSNCGHSGHFQSLVIINSTRTHILPAPSPVVPQGLARVVREQAREAPSVSPSAMVSAAADHGFLDYFNFRNGAFWILDEESKIKATGPLAGVVHSLRESLGLRKTD